MKIPTGNGIRRKSRRSEGLDRSHYWIDYPSGSHLLLLSYYPSGSHLFYGTFEPFFFEYIVEKSHAKERSVGERACQVGLLNLLSGSFKVIDLSKS